MTKNEKISCEHCKTDLKRQLIGSNVFYYCEGCGRITSAKEMTTFRNEGNGAKACVL